MSLRNSVILVDEQDNFIKIEDKLSAHEKALLHRAFSVMLYRYHNGELQFLLQRRATDKYHCAGLWANTCCSHPQIDETIIASGLKRLEEELHDINISKVNLKTIGSFIYKAKFNNGLTEHEYDHVLLGEYSNTPVAINKEEVAEVKWMSCNAIERFYSENKSQFTPWFYQVYTKSIDFLTK